MQIAFKFLTFSFIFRPYLFKCNLYSRVSYNSENTVLPYPTSFQIIQSFYPFQSLIWDSLPYSFYMKTSSFKAPFNTIFKISVVPTKSFRYTRKYLVCICCPYHTLLRSPSQIRWGASNSLNVQAEGGGEISFLSLFATSIGFRWNLFDSFGIF